MTRISTNVNTATPSSVGNISKNRLTRYFHMAVGGDAANAASPRERLLFRQPDGVELVVEIVAGRDRPAVHLGQVRDDPVPLQRVDHVRFVVEQPLLELADEL